MNYFIFIQIKINEKKSNFFKIIITFFILSELRK